MSEEREVLGRAIDREGVWVRVGGEVRLEPEREPDTAREVFEAQRRLVERQVLPFGA